MKKKKERKWVRLEPDSAGGGRRKKKLDRQGDGDKCRRRHRLGGRRTN